MGQYWIGTVVNEDGSHIDVYDNHCGGEYVMAKLMEHSWIGNFYVDSIAKKIYKKPNRVAWIGDYAYDLEDKYLPRTARINIKKLGLEHFHREAYQYCYSDEDRADHYEAPVYEDITTFIPDIPCDPLDVKGKYLVNHDKKQYIDYDEYRHKSYSQGWVVNPLPLLTAIGNDLGGGDYHRGCKFYNRVGYWALDLISIEDEAPEGYQKSNIYFKEIW